MAVTTGTPRRRSLPESIVYVCWCVNVAVLVGLVAWIFSDGRYRETAHQVGSVASALSKLEVPATTRDRDLVFRSRALQALILLAGLSAVGITSGLFAGPLATRRLRWWLAFMALVALWLTLWQTWPDLFWRGQALRLRRQLADVQNIASRLHQSWPTIDGHRDDLGPFMAYPIGQPTVLLLLNSPQTPDAELMFSTIQRSETGALRFQLAGDEAGVWLEWHPAGEIPSNFVGGLQEHHTLARFTKLSENWFFARYD